jgi:hypothetical protein
VRRPQPWHLLDARLHRRQKRVGLTMKLREQRVSRSSGGRNQGKERQQQSQNAPEDCIKALAISSTAIS